MESKTSPFIYILGIAQDAGCPSALCQKPCCKNIPITSCFYATSLALIIPKDLENEVILFDCTPDFKYQMMKLQSLVPFSKISAVFLTHAHIGHCLGLINFGREVLNTNNLDVYCFERMGEFLKNNGHYSQLVQLKNIKLNSLFENQPVKITENIQITPFLVQHRGEFSETCGFQIKGLKRSIIYLPDIDDLKEQKVDFERMVKENDKVFLDGTFFNEKEIGGCRDVKEIPHPFVEDSVRFFEKFEEEDKQKINFIHFNHTNGCLKQESTETKELLQKGFQISKQFDCFEI